MDWVSIEGCLHGMGISGFILAIHFQLDGYKNICILTPFFCWFCPPHPSLATEKNDIICRFCHAQGLNNPSPACNTSETSTNGSRNGPEMDPSVQMSIYPGGWGLSHGHLCTHQVAPSEWQAGPCPGIRSVTTKYLNQIPSCSKSILISYSHYDSVHIWGPGGVS